MSKTNNLVVISDLHSGCRMALCPKGGVKLDDGGKYLPSKVQRKMWAFWREFWDEWVPEATRGEPYDIIFNGDALNGKPFKANTNISDNVADQTKIAAALLKPEIQKDNAIDYYHIRGTEAHSGKAAEHEETLAKMLGAVPNEEGMYARYDLFKSVGAKKLVHCLHHIGVTGSAAYEATAVHKEMTEEFVEACRWAKDRPDVIVRSHRHRSLVVEMPIGSTDGGKHTTGKAMSVVTPAWQGKTPFVWKIPGGRLSTPQFGGILIRWAHDELFIRTKIWSIDRSKTE